MRFELVEAVRPSRLELEQAGSATRVRVKGEMEPRSLM
jgi:hypothetical protein